MVRLNKKLLLLSVSLPFLIVGCYWKDGCLVSPQQVNCFYENNFKVIQGFQKKDTIGSTDVQQREQDLYACGVRNLFGGTLDLNVQYPEMTSKQVDERRNSIYSCIKSKGYIIKSPELCILKGKPTGFCN